MTNLGNTGTMRSQYGHHSRPSWPAAFAAAALVLGPPPGSVHRADAARAGGALKHSHLRGDTQRHRHRQLLFGHYDVSAKRNNEGHTHNDKQHDDNTSRNGRGGNPWAWAESREAIGEVVTAAEELEALDALDRGDTAGLALGLEAMAEDLIEATFPPGCSWSCYLENYLDLSARADKTEAAALEHWMKHGQAERRDCTCRDRTDVEAAPEPKSVEEEEKEEEEEEEEVVETIEALAEKIETLEGEDGEPAAVETLVLAAVEEELIAATFPPGCTWECYLDRHPGLSAHGVEKTEAAALGHWTKHGRAEGRDCTCGDRTERGTLPDGAAAGEEEEVAENIERSAEKIEEREEEEGGEEEEEEVVENIERIAEKIEELEGENDDAAAREALVLVDVEKDLIEATFPPGCTWECYLDRHPWLADRVARTEAAAYAHFARHDLDAWDCRCAREDSSVRPTSGLERQAWVSAALLLLVGWAAREYRASRGGTDARGAHARLPDEGGAEKAPSVEYRDTAIIEIS